MTKLKESLGGILFCLIELLVGILLLINPVGFTTGIIIGFGWLLLVLGLLSIVCYFRTPAMVAAGQQTFAKGLTLSLAGLFCIFRSSWFLSVFPLLTLLYAVGILTIGLVRIQRTMDAIRLKREKWFWSALSAVLSILIAVIILLNPFASTAVMWTFVGVSLIAEAVVDAVILVLTGEHRQK